MRAVFFKELREHARWIPLGMLAIGIALFMSFPAERTSVTAAKGLDYAIASGLGIACGAFAIFLGAMQTLVDQQDGHRGFAFHRAVSEGRILGAKMAAGACLYLAALLPPLLLAFLYLATRSVFRTPMHPGQMLIGLLTSVVCFGLLPVTFLVVQRRARWLGTRLLPFANGAIALTVFAAGISVGGWWLLPIFLLCILLFIACGYASWRSGRVRSSLLVLSSLAVIFCVQMMLGEFVNQFTVNRFEWTSTEYLMDGEGQVWAVKSKRDAYSALPEYLSGSKLEPGFDPDALGVVPDDFAGTPLAYARLSRPQAMGLQYYRETAYLGDQVHIFRPDGYWLAYRTNSQSQFLGMLTQDGLQSGLNPQGQPFSPDTRWERMLVGPEISANLLCGTGGIVLFNDRDGSTTKLFDEPTEWVAWFGDATQNPVNLFVTTEAGIHHLKLVDRGSSADAPTQRWAERSGALEGVEAVEMAKLPKLPSEFSDYALVGEAQGNYVAVGRDAYATFDAKSQRWQVEPMTRAASVDSPFWNIIIGSLTPPAGLGAAAAFLVAQGELGELIATRRTGVIALITVVSTLILALATTVYVCSKRGLTRRLTWAWCAAAALLGLAVPLAVLAIYPRIYREKCEHCGQMRRVDRFRCDHCDAEPVELSEDGIGLFDKETPLVASDDRLACQA